MEVPKSFSKTVYSKYEKQLLKEVKSGPMPQHLAIIMDGNRRYAKEFLEGDCQDGHRLGEIKLEEFLEWCQDLKIRYITVFAFSTENFSRMDEEVNYLMNLCEASLYKVADLAKTHASHMRIRVLGDREALPKSVKEAIEYAENKTANYGDFNFTLALAYGGRQEIISAVKDIAGKVKNGEIDINDISEQTFSNHLYTYDLPDPDMILRTSGEVRISNFLLWQLAYAELYFTDVNWPAFRYIDLLRAIRSYQQRKRRYGV